MEAELEYHLEPFCRSNNSRDKDHMPHAGDQTEENTAPDGEDLCMIYGTILRHFHGPRWV